jgi:hypothetical protein
MQECAASGVLQADRRFAVLDQDPVAGADFQSAPAGDPFRRMAHAAAS